MADEDQAVVEATKDQAKPETAGTDARKEDDLDTLLKAFERSDTKASPSKPDTKTETKPSGETDDLKAIRQELAEQRFQREIGPVLKTVRGDIPADVLSDEEIVDILDGKAKRDERFAEAWKNRQQNPTAWGKVVQAIGRDLQGRFKKLPDKAATEDREAVAAAVRGASTKAPEGKAPDYSRMSDREFADDVEKKYGFRPL